MGWISVANRHARFSHLISAGLAPLRSSDFHGHRSQEALGPPAAFLEVRKPKFLPLEEAS